MEPIRVEPTDDDLQAIARHEHQQLVIGTKALHRRKTFARSLPMESTAQYASRILQRRVDAIEDCSDAELEMLQEWMNEQGGKGVAGSSIQR